MYKILVVEDEKWIRQHIARLIPWNSIDAQVVGEAENGTEALELVPQLQPDIILTDVCMPCGDGLKLIEDLKAISPRTKTIIISGYNDFAYVQQALQLGASDYVLKPVEESALLKSVSKAIEQLAAEDRQMRSLRLLERQVGESSRTRKEHLIGDLIFENYTSAQWARSQLESLGIPNEGKQHICFVIKAGLDHSDPNQKKRRNLVIFGIRNMAMDFAQRLGESEIVASIDDQLICLIHSDATPEVLAHQVAAISVGIRNMVQRIFDTACTIGIGEPCDDLLNIAQSCKQAQEVLSYQNYLGGNSIYTYANLGSMREQESSVQLYSEDSDALRAAVHSKNKEEIKRVIDTIIERIDAETVRPVDLKAIDINVLMTLIHVASEYKKVDESILSLNGEFFHNLYRLKTVEDLHQILYEKALKLADYVTDAQNLNQRRMVDIAMDYIAAHYGESITLTDVAEELQLNPTYFCKLFRKESGQSFTKCLTKYRIAKAKELLADPRTKVYEIAEKVGYSDVQYFNKIFKLETGVSPTSYRDKIK